MTSRTKRGLTPPTTNFSSSAIASATSASSAGIAAALAGLPVTMAVLVPLLSAFATFGATFASERWSQRLGRWWDGVRRGQDEAVFEPLIRARLSDPAMQDVVRESVQAVLEVVDDAAILPLARLCRAHLKKGEPPNRFFRDAASLFTESSAEDLRCFRRALGWLLAVEPEGQTVSATLQRAPGDKMQLTSLAYAPDGGPLPCPR